jgi:transposase
MKSTVRYIGLNVHQDSIAIAVADAGRSPARALASIPHDWHKLVTVLERLGERANLRLCYEAGPTGYELARQLRQHGWHAIVVAPALVPEKKKQLKTDRRDAAALAHFLRSGDLVEVSIPAAQTEAMRDLERARSDAKAAERTARQHVLSFMLRHNRRWTGGTNWTKKHRVWLRNQAFTEPAQQRVLADYLRAIDLAELRVQALTKDIGELVERWALRPLVLGLSALRGFQLVGSVLVAAEIGCFSRFATAGEFMAFLGLVPSEHSTGSRRRLGRITRAGNGHVRRMLIEAAWNYAAPPIENDRGPAGQVRPGASHRGKSGAAVAVASNDAAERQIGKQWWRGAAN